MSEITGNLSNYEVRVLFSIAKSIYNWVWAGYIEGKGKRKQKTLARLYGLGLLDRKGVKIGDLLNFKHLYQLTKFGWETVAELEGRK